MYLPLKDQVPIKLGTHRKPTPNRPSLISAPRNALCLSGVHYLMETAGIVDVVVNAMAPAEETHI